MTKYAPSDRWRLDQFMILWPGDAHMPGVAADGPGLVRKVVVKIALESSAHALQRGRQGRPGR